MSFENFIKLIPPDIHDGVKSVKSDDIIIFRPRTFITNVELNISDYHFVLLSSPPPLTKIENKDYQFKKGKLMALDPETRVLCTTKVPTKEYIAFNVKSQFLKQICWEATGKKEISFMLRENTYSNGLVTSISRFEEEVKYFKNTCPLMIKSMAIQIVIQLLRDASNNVGFNVNKTVPDERYVEKAVEYMEAFYNSNITIEDICSIVHLSQYHFIRMFKVRTGKTPHQYLMLIRLQRAEEMLKRGNNKVEEVAKLCGFVSTAHFASTFKKIKGISPTEFKKSNTAIFII